MRLLFASDSDVIFEYSWAKELGMVPTRFRWLSDRVMDAEVREEVPQRTPDRLHTDKLLMLLLLADASLSLQESVQLSPFVASYSARSAGIAFSQGHEGIASAEDTPMH